MIASRKSFSFYNKPIVKERKGVYNEASSIEGTEKLRYKIPRLELFDTQGLDSETVRSLKMMILAVGFGVIHFNINAGIAMAGYLRALGVTDFIFGLLFAIGPLLSPLQLAASYLLERTRQRKKMFMFAGFVQRVVWLPFGLIPFFIPMDALALRIWMVALFMFTAAFAGPFMNVSFFSLAADIVPEHIRGRYFAVRMRVSTVFGIFGGLMAAWILDNIDPFYSYAVVFALSAAMGTLDVACFFRVKFPEMTVQEKEKGDGFFKMIYDVFQNKPYMRFIFFMTIWWFSISLAGPFILVHLREGVQLSNTLIIAAVQIVPSICAVLAAAFWGRNLDTHGNKPVMQLANGILCFAPFLWVFTGNNAVSVVLVMLIGLMQGLLLPGFDLGVNNVMLGQAPKINRSMYFAMYFTITSIVGVAVGNATGGWLLENVFYHAEAAQFSLLGVTLTRFSYLFALTAVLRCIVVYILLPRMVNVKGERAIPVMELVRGIAADLRRGMAHRIQLLRRRKK